MSRQLLQTQLRAYLVVLRRHTTRKRKVRIVEELNAAMEEPKLLAQHY